MVATDVAVARLRSWAVGVSRDVLEDLEVGSEFAPEETDFLHDGTRVHVEVIGHPVFVTLEWAKFVDQFATNDVSEEDRGFLYIWNGEANVVGSA
jgi:hypothetical protein